VPVRNAHLGPSISASIAVLCCLQRLRAQRLKIFFGTDCLRAKITDSQRRRLESWPKGASAWPHVHEKFTIYSKQGAYGMYTCKRSMKSTCTRAKTVLCTLSCILSSRSVACGSQCGIQAPSESCETERIFSSHSFSSLQRDFFLRKYA
jgi:hypothetical protein